MSWKQKKRSKQSIFWPTLQVTQQKTQTISHLGSKLDDCSAFHKAASRSNYELHHLGSSGQPSMLFACSGGQPNSEKACCDAFKSSGPDATFPLRSWAGLSWSQQNSLTFMNSLLFDRKCRHFSFQGCLFFFFGTAIDFIMLTSPIAHGTLSNTCFPLGGLLPSNPPPPRHYPPFIDQSASMLLAALVWTELGKQSHSLSANVA